MSSPTEGQQVPVRNTDSGRGELGNQEAAQLLRDAIAQVQRVIVEPGTHGRAAHGGPAGQGPHPARGRAWRRPDPGRPQLRDGRRRRLRRLQFTPDLVPSDIVGTRIYKASQESFDVELGPIFVNFVLARTEINRAPAKVQAAMLELMARSRSPLAAPPLRCRSPSS